MSILFDYGESHFTNDFKENINNQLHNEFNNIRNWDQFRVVINLDNKDVSELSLEDIEHGRNVMEIIAKLSRDLWIDYDYYKDFSFKSQHNTNLFISRLENLGYVNENDLWQSKEKPILEDVQLNIFVFCLYQLMIDRKKRDVHNKENMENQKLEQRNVTTEVNIGDDNGTMDEVIITIKCRFCDTENNVDNERCAGCEDDLQEMMEVMSSVDRVRDDINECLGTINEVAEIMRSDNIERLQDNEGSYSGMSRGATGGGDCGNREAVTMIEEIIETKYDINIDAHDESMSEMPSLGNTWKCTHCTFINRWNNDICERCVDGREISDDGDNMGDYDKKYHSLNEASCDSKGIKEESTDHKSLRSAMAPMYPRGNNNESDGMSEDSNKQKKRKIRNNNKSRRYDKSSSKDKYEILQGVDNECITEEYRPSKNASFNDVIGGSLGDGGWHCQMCTMINKSKFHKCQTCGYDRYDLGGHEVRNNDDDRTNKDHVVVDKYIGATASTSVTVTPRDITWSCPSCTYNNKSKDKKCYLCKCGRYDQVSQMTENKDDGPQRRDKIENYKVDKSNRTSMNDNLVHSASKDKYIGATASTSVTAVAQVDTWSCPSCSYNNKSDNICCEVCFSQRQRQSSITVTDDNNDDNIDNIDDDEVETSEEKWTCKKCRCDYLYDKYICDKCHNYAPFFEKWVCDRCRIFNEPLSNNCNACGAKNNHLWKCTKCKFNIVNVDINNICDDCNEDCKDRTELDTEVWLDVKYKKCLKCKNKIDSKGSICKKCTAAMYYCNNRWCGSINSNKMNYCRKCKLKKNVNVTDYNLVQVMHNNGEDEVKMWQCTFCGLFNTMGKISKCTNCKNMRHTGAYKKCSCNWINKDNAIKCDKCFKILPKRT